jgi:hypothetical protein
MANSGECGSCDSYRCEGHNYCRMCGFHLTSGFAQNVVRMAVAYNTAERFCGFCGRDKGRCSCNP